MLRQKPYYGNIVVFWGFLVLMMSVGSTYSFGIFFRPLAEDMGWNFTMTSSAFSGATIIAAICAIPIGRLIDRYGARIPLTIAGLIIGLGYGLMSIITSFWQVYLFFSLLTGCSMAVPGIVAMSSTSRWFNKNRGLMVGIVVTGAGAGSIAIPYAAAHIITLLSWRNAYLILGGTLMLVLVTAAQFIKLNPEKTTDSQKRVSQEHDSMSQMSKSQSISSILLMLVRYRQFWLMCLAYFCAGFYLQMIMVHIASHAQDLGIKITEAAVIFTVFGICSIFGKLAFGFLIDKRSSKWALCISFFIVALSIVWLVNANNLSGLIVFGAILGLGYGGAIVTQPSLVADLFGMKQHATLMGVVTFSMGFGSAVGPLVGGYFHDIYGTYDGGFLTALGMVCVGIIALLLLHPIHQNLK